MSDNRSQHVTRAVGITVGIGTHLLFAFTVWHLVWFLVGHSGALAPLAGSGTFRSTLNLIAADTLLAAGFAIPHSFLLLPAVRRWLVERVIPAPFYGCFFCVVTCLALLMTIFCWRTSAIVVWAWPQGAAPWVVMAFIAAWVFLLWSLHLTGLGYQTGFTPWWQWVWGLKPQKREFVTRGAYLFLRHPVYLAFLGLVWLTPVVTLDRAVLIVVWTAYIYVGSVLKDSRLLLFIGKPYREYQSRVPGYPGIPLGPLARLPFVTGGP